MTCLSRAQRRAGFKSPPYPDARVQRRLRDGMTSVLTYRKRSVR
jgi:hypothetical protein